MEQSDRKKFERALADRLFGAGRIDAAGLDRALRLSAAGEERLEEILAKLGLVNEKHIAEAMALELGLPVAAAADYPDAPILEGISAKFLKHARVIPLADTPEGIVLAMANPLDPYPVESIGTIAGKPILVRVATAADIEVAFERLYENGKSSIGQIVAEIGEADDDVADEDVNRLRDLASEAPVIRLVNLLISRGVESRASDIHIEPFHNRLIVRYRIDGLLRESATPPPRLRAAIVSRIKIMAKLNIAERRLPQDGRIRIAIRGKDYDLRVATVPTLHGESVTMRILDRTNLVEDFAVLGFRPDALEVFLDLLDRPQGILLVTGPTGSGKTTTLYTSLLRLNTAEKKIFTVEEPIEYQLEGVNQIQVKPQINLTFANVLRTLLRHNPNVIMIGEMRDLETAQIAIQAALTGHLVLSTLHTNSAASSVTRLLDMKVEDYLITSTVTGIMAQRLVRKLCHCREAYPAIPEVIASMKLLVEIGENPMLYRPVGCEHCHGGYSGQTAIIEVLTMSNEIRRLVIARAEAREIHQAALAQGMRSMEQDGMLKALAGETTIEEVLRVTRDM
jgi:general secretion pathway protein E